MCRERLTQTELHLATQSTQVLSSASGLPCSYQVLICSRETFIVVLLRHVILFRFGENSRATPEVTSFCFQDYKLLATSRLQHIHNTTSRRKQLSRGCSDISHSGHLSRFSKSLLSLVFSI